MKKKYTYLLLFIFIAILIYMLNKTLIVTKKDADNYFIQYETFFSAPAKSEYNIDIAYFYNKNMKNPLNNDNIQKISFKNSNLTNIKNFKIVKSDSSKKYDIGTLSLSIDFLNEGKETIEFLEVLLVNGEKLTYPIGKWSINVSNDKIGNHLLIGNEHPVMTKYFNNKYRFSLKNNYNGCVKVTNIDVYSPNYSSSFKEFTINSHKEFKDVLYFEPIDKSDKVNFSIIRPKIEYLVNNNKYAFYPNVTYCGYLNITDETIEKEVQKSIQNNKE